ncbi:MAG TPA: GDP-mannose 4,6-dehydratase [Thermoanaerobaculia bacterium]|jgi:GDP-4-dehydro-6-deoxy-D-mannose reductase|nr:GDP-mannose 4,6-dehydratase [Thermoanaerobaculia bacterium]
MKVLITGVTGFAGSHLADLLLDRHPEMQVAGMYRWRSPMDNLEGAASRITLYETDLRDYISVQRTLEAARPDLIFHLAAQSFVPASWTGPAETLTTNLLGQTYLFEAVRALRLDPVIQIACSSEEYGLVLPDEVPIRETNPLRPRSPYAVSKVAQDYQGYQYFQSYGMRIVRTRAFNHTGPRRGDVFAMSSFAKQLATIELGQSEPVLRVGNLEAIRDFTDVRDVVRAYVLAATRAEPGEVYNISSGRGQSIRELLDTLVSLSEVEVEVKVDPQRLRPSDVEILIGDSTKFRERTGWAPTIPLETTLADLLDYWRRRLRTAR